VAGKPQAGVFGLVLILGCGGGQPAGAPPPAADEEPAAHPAAAAPAPAAPKPVPLDSSLIPEPGAELSREMFAYRGGSRDPFISLLEGRSGGPELGDLDVVGVMYSAQEPSTSTAVLWDRVNAKQYTAREGERVGRARVIGITERAVRFTIDDFGTQRQVTLAIRKREDVP
jgi:hypothetical protein